MITKEAMNVSTLSKARFLNSLILKACEEIENRPEFRAKTQTADGEVISSRLIPFRNRVLVLDEN